MQASSLVDALKRRFKGRFLTYDYAGEILVGEATRAAGGEPAPNARCTSASDALTRRRPKGKHNGPEIPARWRSAM
jgi:hypothetical protein